MEANRTRTQVHMLPTNGKDIAMLSKRVKDGMLQSANGAEGVANCNTMWQPQHLYITTDEEIKEGDWCVRGNKVHRYVRKSMGTLPWLKIIATTDPKLIADGVSSIGLKLIQDYCNKGGIDEVWIECFETMEDYGKELNPKRPEPYHKWKLKLNSNNEIIIYNVDDLLLMECLNAIEYLTDELNTNQFDTLIKKIEENLKIL